MKGASHAVRASRSSFRRRLRGTRSRNRPCAVETGLVTPAFVQDLSPRPRRRRDRDDQQRHAGHRVAPARRRRMGLGRWHRSAPRRGGTGRLSAMGARCGVPAAPQQDGDMPAGRAVPVAVYAPADAAVWAPASPSGAGYRDITRAPILGRRGVRTAVADCRSAATSACMEAACEAA